MENETLKKYHYIKKTLIELSINKHSNDIIEKDEGDTYFLVISIDEYQDEHNLRISKANSNKFINIFNSEISIKQKNIYSLFDKDATKINILKNLHGLNNVLKHKDKLIIYFSGHGFQNQYSNFFIPFDGSRNNFNSCIPNDYIFSSLTQMVSYTIVVFFDLKFSKTNFKSINNENAESKRTISNLIQSKKPSSLFEKFIEFYTADSGERIKQTFLIIKNLYSEPRNNYLNNINPDNLPKRNPLSDYLYTRQKLFINLIKQKKTSIVLDNLINILNNNDPDLLSQIGTLKFKLEQYKHMYGQSKVTKQELLDNTEFIDNITCDIIEKIKKRGFYLINTPQNQDQKQIESKDRIKILFASANPINQKRLRLEKEAREIEYELLKSKDRDNFEFIQKHALRISDLQFALLNNSPHFIHFSGHGNCDGIALLDDNDNSQLVKASPLAKLFKLFANEIQ